MRHLNLDDLLALQDGEELAEAQAHLIDCPTCAGELQELKHRQRLLRNLRPLRPARDAWPQIRARIAAGQRRRKAALIAGAAALIILVLAPLFGTRSSRPVSQPEQVSELIKQSQGWEEKLRSVPEPEMLDFQSAEAIVELEDQIALVDQWIGDFSGVAEHRDELPLLWQTRIELLQTLVNMRNPTMAFAFLEGPVK
jgi:hypothetical protein